MGGHLVILRKRNQSLFMLLVNSLKFYWLGHRFDANFEFSLFACFSTYFLVVWHILDNEGSHALSVVE